MVHSHSHHGLWMMEPHGTIGVIMTRSFYVKISSLNTTTFHVGYYYNTDLRWDKTYSDLPVREILDWLKENDNPR